jgi:flagellar hook protein FlgE
MGVENAVDIDLAAFKLTPTGSTSPAPLPFTFTTVQEGNGEGTSADFLVYDSLGSALRVRISTVLESRSSTEARFRWIATSSDNAPLDGVQSFVGSGVLLTDGFGKFVSSTNDEIAIDRGSSPAASPLIFSLDFKEVTGLDSQERSELSASRQDGFPAGTLSSFIITETGRIQGVFSNGATRDLGQVRMARFANNAGLQQLGENLFAAGVNAGLPVEGNPGSQGLGAITAGAVELSNTDIGQNLIKLILASTQYRGGARVITSVQELLDELLALRR